VRGRMVEDSHGLKSWRGQPMALELAVKVELEFLFARPVRPERGYPCTGGGLDIEKLVRAAHDAMTGIVWCDDSQVVELVARKAWGGPGVRVMVAAL
jgi:Holliday junction resolvase RusA-like endonuclease